MIICQWSLQRWEDVRVRNFKSQIYAYRAVNIAIRGDGHFEDRAKMVGFHEKCKLKTACR
jgi:hypothetical protein